MQRKLDIIKKSFLSKCKNPYSYSFTKICELKKFQSNLEFEERKDINIVSISLPPIPIEEFIPIVPESRIGAEHLSENENPLSLKVFGYRKEISEQQLSLFKESIKFAVEEYDADIICLNELGMPLNGKGEPRKKALRFAKKVANSYKCLIVAGSSHSKSKYVNSGFCFYPTINESEKGYIEFYKNISATQESEKIYTPPKRIIFRTKAFNIGISFMICLELVDYSSSAQIAKNHEFIDLLIVPTYLADYGIMYKVAQSVSNAMGGVLLINHFDNSRRDPPVSRFYLCGKEYEKTMENSKLISNKVQLIKRTINVSEFNKMKQKSVNNIDDNIRCLYGIAPVIRN